MRVPLAILALAISVPAAAADVTVTHGKVAALVEGLKQVKRIFG